VKNITTENITVKHLINIQRICRRKMNDRFFSIDQNKYMDENCDETVLHLEYHKNH
jgi:hypothetical protein